MSKATRPKPSSLDLINESISDKNLIEQAEGKPSTLELLGETQKKKTGDQPSTGGSSKISSLDLLAEKEAESKLIEKAGGGTAVAKKVDDTFAAKKEDETQKAKSFLEQDYDNWNRFSIDGISSQQKPTDKFSISAIQQIQNTGIAGGHMPNKQDEKEYRRRQITGGDDFGVIKNYANERIKALTEEIVELEEKKKLHIPSGGYEGAAMRVQIDPAIDAVQKEKQKYLDDLKKSISQVSNKAITKQVFKGVPITMDKDAIMKVGVLKRQLLGDNKVSDDTAKITALNVAKTNNELETKQTLQARNWMDGRDAVMGFMQDDLAEKIRMADPKKLAEAQTLMMKREADAAAFKTGGKPQVTVAELQKLNTLLADKNISSYFDSLKEYEGTMKGIDGTFKKNFPELVKRQQRINMINQLANRRQIEYAVESNIAVPGVPAVGYGRRMLHSIFGTSASDEDLEAIVKTMNAKGDPITIDEAKDIQKNYKEQMGIGWNTGADPIRVKGFISNVASGIDDVWSGIGQGANRIFASKAYADKTNELIQNRLENYGFIPENQKLLQKGADGKNHFNFNYESVLNTIGTSTGNFMGLGAFNAPVTLGAELAAGKAIVKGAGALKGVDGMTRAAQIVEETQAALSKYQKLEKALQFSTTTAAGTLAAYEQGYQNASKYTSDEKVRHGYAFITSLPQGLSENILSPANLTGKIFGKGILEAGENVTFKTFEAAVKAKGLQGAILDGLKAGSKTALSVIAEESAEELVPIPITAIADKVMLGKDTTPGELGNSMLETFVQTAIGTMGLGFGAGMRRGRDRSNILKESLFEAGMNPDTYRAYFNKSLATGEITQEEADRNIRAVNTMEKIVSKMPTTKIRDGVEVPLTQKEAATLAAQEYRIRHNNKLIADEPLQSQIDIINQDTEEALAIQNAIINPSANRNVGVADDDVKVVAQSAADKIDGRRNDIATILASEEVRGTELVDSFLDSFTPEELEIITERPEELPIDDTSLIAGVNSIIRGEPEDISNPIELNPEDTSANPGDESVKQSLLDFNSSTDVEKKAKIEQLKENINLLEKALTKFKGGVEYKDGGKKSDIQDQLDTSRKLLEHISSSKTNSHGRNQTQNGQRQQQSESDSDQEARRSQQQLPNQEPSNQNGRGKDGGQQKGPLEKTEGGAGNGTPSSVSKAEDLLDDILSNENDATISTLMNLRDEHRRTPANATKKLSQIEKQANDLANQIGATIKYTDTIRTRSGKGGKRNFDIVDEAGVKMKRPSVKMESDTSKRAGLENRSEEFQSFYNSFLPQLERSLNDSDKFEPKVDLGIPATYVRSGLKAIAKRKPNAHSFDVLDALEGQYNSGYIDFVQRAGKTNNRIGVPIEAYMDIQEEAAEVVDEMPEDELLVWGEFEPQRAFDEIPEQWPVNFEAFMTERFDEGFDNEFFPENFQEDYKANREEFDEQFAAAFPDEVIDNIKALIDETTDNDIQGEQEDDTVLPDDGKVPEGSKENTDGKPVGDGNEKTKGQKFLLTEGQHNEVVDNYLASFEGVADPDKIRTFIPDYDAAFPEKYNYDMAVILNSVYDKLITSPDYDAVSFVIGGPGVGKSSVMTGAKADRSFVWDGVFTDNEKLVTFVEKATGNGKAVHVNLVYNVPTQAFANIIKRYHKGKDRRVVRLEYFIRATNAQDGRIDFLKQFPDVSVVVFDNSENNNKPVILESSEGEKLQFGLTESQQAEIKNLIENDNELNDTEKQLFLAGWVGENISTDKGEKQPEETGGQGSLEGTGGELEGDTAEQEVSRLSGLTNEEKAVMAMIDEKQKQLATAEKKLKTKIKSLEKTISNSTPDLFGATAEGNANEKLFSAEIDLTQREVATKREKGAVQKIKNELNSLYKQLERIQGKPSAQTEMFEEGEYKFVAPPLVEMLDRNVSAINEVNDEFIAEHQGKVEPLQKELKELVSQQKATRNKDEKKELELAAQAIQKRIDQIDMAAQDAQEAQHLLFFDYMQRRAAQEGLPNGDELVAEMVADVYNTIYERPGIEWAWQEKLDSVVSGVLANYQEGNKIDALDILKSPDVDTIADFVKQEFLSTRDFDYLPKYLYTMVNNFVTRNFEGLVNDSSVTGAWNNRYYSQPLERILGIELPSEARSKAEKQNLMVLFEKRYDEIFKPNDDGTLQGDTEQSGGSGKSGNRRNDAAKPDKGLQKTTVRPTERGGKTDSNSTESGEGVQPENGNADSIRTEPIGGEGNSLAGNNAAVRLMNYTIPTDFKEQSTWNKNIMFNNNIEALKLLFDLESTGRLANPDEQSVLAKYVGFGGLKEILLDPAEKGWKEIDERYRDKVQAVHDAIKLFDPTGAKGLLKGIKAGVLNAHFTPHVVTKSIWHGLALAGFKGGSFLEPSAGKGNFIAAMPQAMSSNSEITAVEIDELTGRLLKQLYPLADVHIKGLQDARLPENHYDIVVSNVPFGSTSVFDPMFASKDKRYQSASKSIHNYFFAKGLDLVRPGGVVAFVTSKGTMDSSKSQETRELIAEQGEMIGAIRLPDTTFKAAAGTEVVADIIFIRKYDIGETKILDQSFVKSKSTTINGTPVSYNSYFHINPDMMLGKVELGGLYSNDSFNLSGKGVDLESAINTAIGKIFTKELFTEEQKQKNERVKKETSDYVNNEEYDKIGNIVVLPSGDVGRVTGDIYKDEELDAKAWAAGINPDRIRDGVVDSEKLESVGLSADMFNIRAVEKLRLGKEQREKAPLFTKIRAFVNKLFYQELNGYNDFAVTNTRKALKGVYDDFVKQFGRLNAKDNYTLVKQDADQWTILALEKKDESGRYVPSDVFTQRTIKPVKKLDKVDNVHDAILVSLEEFGNLNLHRIGELLGKSAEQVLIDETREGGAIFEQPNNTFVSREEYLSGNVKQKLQEAKDARMEHNVSELQKVQPADIEAIDIYSPMNARWLPTAFLKQFLQHVMSDNSLMIRYSRSNDSYTVSMSESAKSDAFSTSRKKASWIVEHALNGIEPIVKYTDREGKTYIDETDTAVAKDNYKKLRNLWDQWKYEDETIRNNIQEVYNKVYNTTILRQYDGSHLQLPGMLGFELRPHQKDGVWRFVTTKGGIADHIVGSGKTLMMIATAMEGRRLGVFKKPLITGLKSQIPQFAAEFRKAYPLAKILFPSQNDFKPENRKRLLSQIATNDWDAIILTHENLNAIPMPVEIQVKLIDELCSEIEDEMRGITDKKELKGLENRLSNYRQRIANLKNVKKDEDILDFSQLGIDFMMVDESQEFKNLEFITKKRNVRGLGNMIGSKRAFNMLISCRYLQNLNGGDKGILFASGTPISNTMAELYLLFKYLRPNKMLELGIRTFDQWAALFAEDFTDLEYYMGRFKEVSRFRQFVNLPELITMYQEIADVRNANNIVLDRPKAIHTLVKIEPTNSQLEYIGMLQEYIATKGNAYKETLGLENGYDEQKGVNPSYAVLATTFAKKLSVDPRLIDADAGEGSKIEAAARNILEEYVDSTPYKGTQLVFCDLGTPKTKDQVTNLYNFLEDEGMLSDTEMIEVFGESFGEGGKKPALSQIKTKLLAKEDDGTGKYLDITEADFDNLVREANTAVRFDVYNALKKSLIELGIAPEEIEFIHDHDSRSKREKLYERVNNGDVRVLIGSTRKMGVGVNVQKRVIAGHHLDITWKPADLEQRNGRFERQMNIMAKMHRDNKVQAYYYATERTLDASMYELVNTKAKFIAQLKLGGAIQRRMKDIAEDDVDMGAMAAELSGDPIFKKKAVLTKEVQKLNESFTAWQRKKYSAESAVNNDRRIIEYRQELIERKEAAIARLSELNEEYKPEPKTDEEKKKEKEEDKVSTLRVGKKQIMQSAVVNGKKIQRQTFIAREILEVLKDRTAKTSVGKSFNVAKMNGVDIIATVQYDDRNKSFYNDLQLMLDGVEIDKFTASSNDISLGIRLRKSFEDLQENVDYSKSIIAEKKKDVPVYEAQSKIPFVVQDKDGNDVDGMEELNSKIAELATIDNTIKAQLKLEQDAKIAKYKDNENTEVDTSLEEEGLQYVQGLMFNVMDLQTPTKLQATNGDFVTIERKFSEQKHLMFSGTEKIESHADVAWLFRNLETQGVENAYAVFIRKDGSYFTQHLGTGIQTGVMVEPKVIVNTAIAEEAVKVVFVHNHPSGNLKPSDQDHRMFGRLKEALEDIAELEAIIMNLTSGNYATFDEDIYDPTLKRATSGETNEVAVHSFDRIAFLRGYNPAKIFSTQDVAAYLTSRKYGAGGKPEVLLISRRNHILGKVSLPINTIKGNVSKAYKTITTLVTTYGANGVIVFGNVKEAEKDMQALKGRLRAADIEMLDYVQVSSQYNTASYSEQGFLEPENTYNAAATVVNENMGLSDSSSKEDSIINAFANYAFITDLGVDDFLKAVTQRFGSKANFNKRLARLGWEKAQPIIMDVLANYSNDAKISLIKKSVGFAPLMETIDNYVFKKKQAIKEAVPPDSENIAPVGEEEEIETPNPSNVDDDFIKNLKITTSETEVENYRSKITLENVFDNLEYGNQEYAVTHMAGLVNDGNSIVEWAKEKWGNEAGTWAPALLDHLRKINVDTIKKIVAVARVMHELNAVKSTSNNNDVKKAIGLATRMWQELMHDAGVALNAGKLLKVLRDGDFSSFFTDGLMTEKQVRKKKIMVNTESNSMVTDDAAEKGVGTTTEDVKDAAKKIDNPVNDAEKKRAAKLQEYANKANALQTKISSSTSIQDLINKLKC